MPLQIFTVFKKRDTVTRVSKIACVGATTVCALAINEFDLVFIFGNFLSFTLL